MKKKEKLHPKLFILFLNILQDPLDKLAALCSVREPTVDDLVNALCVTSEEAKLIQIMTIGQGDNPLWMDARQWHVTASNFGRVCNRNFRVLYPPSHKKRLILETMGKCYSMGTQS